MYIGAAYYPEFFPKERWEIDATLMQELGFNAVRMAEFAWCRLEPTEGDYQFGWLDDAIELFASKGIKTVLGTPTGAPPHWLYKAHPEISPVEETGYRLQIGSFGSACQTTPAYLTYARKIVHEMATHYKDNANVIFYQIDNEIPSMSCYCEHCLKAFQIFMERQHGTIENYNRNLMTIFQGRELNDFSDLFLPTKGRMPPPPALMSEYRKFVSHNAISFCKMQVDTIRAVDGNTPITTNYDSLIEGFDHFAMAKFLDCVGMDVYPKADSVTDLERNSFYLDFARSTGKDKGDYWILEQQCSPVAFAPRNYPQQPGEVLLYTLNSLAHGAEHIMYFRFNVTNGGGERFGAGILRHDQRPGRTYQEVQDTVKDIDKVKPFLEGSVVQKKRVAIVYSYVSRWMIHTAKAPSRDLSYDEEVARFYRYCYKHHIPVDFVAPLEDLSAYHVVLAPMLASVDEKTAAWLAQFTSAGGTVVCGAFSGIYNEYNYITTNYYQGELRSLLGIKALEWHIPYEQTEGAVSYHRKLYDASCIHMLLEREDAVSVAQYTADFYANTSAVTCNTFGKGHAYYLGVLGNEDLLADVLADVFAEHAKLAKPVVCGVSEGVVIVCREAEEYELIFVLNPTSVVQNIVIDAVVHDVLSDTDITGNVAVAPKQSFVFYHSK